ncbi:DM13 domain-containing protein [Nocardia sp. NPDC051052]|uniref:DM13 domain-containing protein n=1 Tax=Nocardia sp. NPDC051052 TaxID=3364322 RepID=UPI0037A96554
MGTHTTGARSGNLRHPSAFGHSSTPGNRPSRHLRNRTHPAAPDGGRVLRTDLTALTSVTIWCQRFHVSFGAARLTTK